MKAALKILLLGSLILIASFVVNRVMGYSTYSFEDKTRYHIIMIAEIANESIAEIQKQKLARGVSTFDAFASLDLVRPKKLNDAWGNRLRIGCVDAQCSAVVVESMGNNGVDDFGQGDDLVSRRIVKPSAANE